MHRLVAAGSILAVLGGSVALSQTGGQQTPSVSPQALRSLAETDVSAAQIAQLKAKVDQQAAALADVNARLAAATKRIDALELAQKTIATKGLENAGKISALDAEFQSHNHYSMYLQQVPEGGTMKTKVMAAVTTIPAFHCKPNPAAGGTGALSSQFVCDPAFKRP